MAMDNFDLAVMDEIKDLLREILIELKKINKESESK